MAELTEVYSEKQFQQFQPLMICNIEKDQEISKKIYSRSLPINGYNTNTLGPRSSFKVCNNYKNMMPNNSYRNSHQSRYSKNIDIETKLRKVKAEKYPENKRNVIIDGDNYLEQILTTIHTV